MISARACARHINTHARTFLFRSHSSHPSNHRTPPPLPCSIMNSTGPPGSPSEGALQYIRQTLRFAKKPVFLVVSIVNPHDVLFYPSQARAVLWSEFWGARM